jgi:hypothetical protein
MEQRQATARIVASRDEEVDLRVWSAVFNRSSRVYSRRWRQELSRRRRPSILVAVVDFLGFLDEEENQRM